MPRAARSGRGALRALGGAALAAVAALALHGCSIQPWVKPYERDHLADPIMSFDRDPVSTSYTDHVREAREGARGATGASGGGCGCN
ncbi:MAG TPA: DUF4266 domain-containing protein [Gammaproteobacteria bacterium]|nr:DUF4266 domain-containing protein [Gammaproteobacteria bacterium]